MRIRAWTLYLVAALVAVAGYFLTPADTWTQTIYPGLAIGLLLLIRRRSDGHDWSSLVDATTIATGLGLLSWVFVIRPIAADSSLSLVARVVSIAYPIGDLLVLD